MSPQRQSRHPAQRVYPHPGSLLTIRNIGGSWRPSGTAGGVGVFAVVWDDGAAIWWAPLHDFDEADQRRLIDACRRIDHLASPQCGACEECRG